MSDTPGEDYEIRCDDAALALVRCMDNLSEARVEDSHADEWGDDPDFESWYWSGTLVLKTDMKQRVYRIPFYCDNEAGDVSIGTADWDGGDSLADVYRQMWIIEVTASEGQSG